MGARRGRALYLDGDRMMVVEVKTEPSLNVGRPRVLFVAIERDEDAAWQIHVVLKWEKELEPLVPIER